SARRPQIKPASPDATEAGSRRAVSGTRPRPRRRRGGAGWEGVEGGDGRAVTGSTSEVAGHPRRAARGVGQCAAGGLGEGGAAAGRADAGGLDPRALLERPARPADVLGDQLGRPPAFDQPVGAAEAELDLLRLRRLDVNMVVRVVADGVSLAGELTEPFHVV